jgi:hypothetical protein
MVLFEDGQLGQNKQSIYIYKMEEEKRATSRRIKCIEATMQLDAAI